MHADLDVFGVFAYNSNHNNTVETYIIGKRHLEILNTFDSLIYYSWNSTIKIENIYSKCIVLGFLFHNS